MFPIALNHIPLSRDGILVTERQIVSIEAFMADSIMCETVWTHVKSVIYIVINNNLDSDSM